jgi:hypothetical protein
VESNPQGPALFDREAARIRQALVAASGTQGTRIDVWGTTDQVGVPRRLPAYVTAVLRSLGYRAHLHLVRSPASPRP